MVWLLCTALVSPALATTGDIPDGPTQGPARELWLEAHQLFQVGDYVNAADRFDRAYELERAAWIAVWVARSLTRAGRFVDAVDRYREIAEQPLASDASSRDWAARRDAKAERQELLPRVPNLIVTLVGAPRSEVLLDVNGVALPSEFVGVPRSVDPGVVRVHGERGFQHVEQSIEIGEGETKTVQLSFLVPARNGESRSEPARPNGNGDAQRVASFVAVGVGGAALLTGGVFAALAAGDEGRLLNQCPMSRCAPRFRSSIDTYESKKTVATVALWSGAALLTSGIVLYLTLPRRNPKSSSLGAYFGGSQAGVWGSF
ncbi:MAG: tetratricopeptide repeat protein [Myxococcota bacterium]